MKFFRKLLIFLHRYLGIALCLLFVVWFSTGIAMIYAKAMPGADSAASRLEHLPPLDFLRFIFVHPRLRSVPSYQDRLSRISC